MENFSFQAHQVDKLNCLFNDQQSELKCIILVSEKTNQYNKILQSQKQYFSKVCIKNVINDLIDWLSKFLLITALAIIFVSDQVLL